jgi:predicted RNase H-like HicB family nuclease
MAEKKLHAVIYKDQRSEEWVAFCVEYNIASQGDNEAHALEMLQEAVELHMEDVTPDVLDQIDNEVGSEPIVKAFSIRAPAILQ